MDIKSKKGVTLVEVVTAVAIMAIILVPVSLVFATAYSNFIVQSDRVTAQQGAREILFGKGYSPYYGVMGCLERSDASTTADLIKIEDPIDANKGRSISITEITKDGVGQTKIYYYEPATATSIGNLRHKIIASDGSESDVNYFEDKKSSSGSEVEVKAFVIEKINKGSNTDPVTDTDLIKITVTVVCGRSGDITLQSSYRIPNFERP